MFTGPNQALGGGAASTRPLVMNASNLPKYEPRAQQAAKKDPMSCLWDLISFNWKTLLTVSAFYVIGRLVCPQSADISLELTSPDVKNARMKQRLSLKNTPLPTITGVYVAIVRPWPYRNICSICCHSACTQRRTPSVGKLVGTFSIRRRGGARGISAAGRRRIAAAQKARWAKWKKQQKQL